MHLVAVEEQIADVLGVDVVISTSPAILEDGEPYYRINHGDGHNQLVSFDPSGMSIAGRPVPGFWGVLTGGDDAANASVSAYALMLEVFILAELSEHADRSAAQTAHEV